MGAKDLTRRKEASKRRTTAPRTHHDRLVAGMICIFLAAIVWITFGQTLRYEFVNYDDDNYVYENPRITSGLTFSGIEWAFTHVHAANWHPLTTISHMLDCQLYGLQPWGHHLTNILLQAAAAILLFLALRRLTGNIWPSAFVAAIFAIHPLRVESVAWISERKDVLSGVFFMLTLWAYARYARSDRPSFGRYLTVVVLFALGLMCKPTLVTLPFVLLLLDYWPLGRWPGVAALVPSAKPNKQAFGTNASTTTWSVARGLIIEKIPLFILSAASCLATILAQKHALEATSRLSFAKRLGNAVVSYVAYLGQTIYPARLAVFYPYQTGSLKVSEVILAFLLLLVLFAICFIWRRKYPFLLIGWLWYLGMLVPMIGLAQVGSQARADRYTYLPQIGLCILLAWGAMELFAKWRRRREVLSVAALLIITALVARSYDQTSYWRNSTTLWRHAIDTTSHNYVAHNNLGNVLLKKGQLDEAIAHYQEALEINGDYPDAHNNLGNALMQNGQVDDAIAQQQKALAIKPDFAEAESNLGNALLKKGDVDQASAHYQKALQLKPNFAEVQCNLGNALLQKGDVDQAIAHYQEAIKANPNYAEAHCSLSNALSQKGESEEAMVELQRALEIKPDYAEAHNNMGAALVQKGELDAAIDHYQKAVAAKPAYAQAENNLGDALLREGRVDEAIVHLQRALQIDPEYAGTCNDLGSAFMLKGQIDEAISSYEKAVQIKPDYAEAHNNLGSALLQEGQVNEAIAHYQKALQIQPAAAEVHNNLGNAFVRKGNWADAIASYEAALRIRPNYPQAHNQLGLSLSAMGKTDEALKQFNEALRINENYPEAHYDLGHLLVRMGRPDEAIPHLTEALRLKPDYPDAEKQLRELGVPLPH